MTIRMRLPATAACLMTGLATLSTAQLSWPGCEDVTDDQFRVVDLITRGEHQLSEPIKMAFDMTEPGVDVYVVERKGRVLMYEAATGRVSTVGNIDTETGGEDGLTGIALDPDFKTNRWMYLYYSGKEDFRVVRVTVRGKTLDLSTMKVLLTIPSNRGTWHTGGSMRFDDYGDLWIGAGDNKQGHLGPANTNDLRGKILRIHPIPFADGESPDEGPGSTYTVPEGNLFPPGTEKTRPEIYIMGVRNPYTIALDPVRRWVAWGGFGPDHMNGNTEEYNLFTEPVNAGFPFWTGDQTVSRNYGMDFDGGSKTAPKNTHEDNTGLIDLPPARDPIFAIPRSGSETGPIYRYDGDLQSKVKFPPHYHRKWFITNWDYKWIAVKTLGEDGLTITGSAEVLKNVGVDRPTDFQAGPDGALYLLNYAGWFSSSNGTKLVRIEYTGDCHPQEPKMERAATSNRARPAPGLTGRFTVKVLPYGALRRIRGPEGWRRAELYDVEGRLLMQVESRGRPELVLPEREGLALRVVKFR